jgi:acyl-CoA hydrolase
MIEMTSGEKYSSFDNIKRKYPGKIISDEKIFRQIHRGDRIFIHTGCGEPQHLINSLASYVESYPKAFFLKFFMSGH